MAKTSKKSSVGASNTSDIFFLLTSVAATAVFAWGFMSWTAYRDQVLPGEQCLRQGDVDCVLSELNDHLGPNGATDARDIGLWELRLLKAEGNMQQKLDQVMGTPDDNVQWSTDRLRSLLKVSDDLHELGHEDKAIEFAAEVLDRHEKKYGENWPSRQYVEPQYRNISPDGGGFCWTRMETGMYDSPEYNSAIDPDAKDLKLRDIPLPGWGEEGIACGAVYLASLSDEELSRYINTSLDVMREQRKKFGEYERQIYASSRPETTTAVYIGNIAFLALALAYKEDPQSDFGLS